MRPWTVVPAGVSHDVLSSRRTSSFGIPCARAMITSSSTIEEQPPMTGKVDIEYLDLLGRKERGIVRISEVQSTEAEFCFGVGDRFRFFEYRSSST